VEVKILTGDHERVSAAICAEVGLALHGSLTGPQIEAMDDAALQAAVLQTTLFARLNPLHKERVVRALRAHGRVVGFLGDGINDAPALRAADIGLSVDSAVDIARESADIILLEKSLMVLHAGVAEGRRTFANMLKYIRTTASSNFGNVLSVTLASACLPFLPMLPIQLLVQNLLYDLSQTTIPFDRVEAAALRHPPRWHTADIRRTMLCFGPLSTLIDLACFALLWWAFDARDSSQQALFQSGWFLEGLLSQVLAVHLFRSQAWPFVQSRAALPLLASSAAIGALGIWLVQGPVGAALGFVALPSGYFLALAGLLGASLMLTQCAKAAYVRRWGWPDGTEAHEPHRNKEKNVVNLL
jgi:Mg2+-importing ATPase